VAIALATSALASGCEKFASPAELDRTQILAIASEPAVIAPGGRTSLGLLVAGPDGEVASPPVTWTVVEQPGQPAIGRIEIAPDGSASYVAPDTVSSDPAGTLVQAAVEVDDKTLLGVKAVVIGSLDLLNPAVSALEVDGEPLAEGDSLALSAGQSTMLRVRLDPDATDDAEVAWYSTALSIDRYRLPVSTPTEAIAADTPTAGWLFAVVRDRGGVGWRAVQVEVR
jgi:hypothetical protein